MVDALLVIDFQNDFTPGGALAVEGGDEIAEPVRRLAEHVDVVVATRDWHPPDHASFVPQGGPWPVHCVQGTRGAELHPAMEGIEIDAIVDVGRERDDEGYSGFEKSDLARILRERESTGLRLRPRDRLLRARVGDRRLPRGLRGRRRRDAIRAVEVAEGDGERALADMRAAEARTVSSEDLLTETAGG